MIWCGTHHEFPAIDMESVSALLRAWFGMWPHFFDFFASLVASTAWPAVVLILLLLFRRQIERIVDALKDRMPGIESVEALGVKMVWSSSAVERVKQHVDAGGESTSAAPSSADEAEDVAVRLARLQPSAGVISAFLDVERKAGELLDSLGVPWKLTPINTFRRSPAVPEQMRSILADLSSLRNAAAHGVGDISEESALEYIESARRFAARMDFYTHLNNRSFNRHQE